MAGLSQPRGRLAAVLAPEVLEAIQELVAERVALERLLFPDDDGPLKWLSATTRGGARQRAG